MEQTPKTKVLKSYRLDPEIVEALRRGQMANDYAEETAYLEDVLRLALGLGLKAESQRTPRVRKVALAA